MSDSNTTPVVYYSVGALVLLSTGIYTAGTAFYTDVVNKLRAKIEVAQQIVGAQRATVMSAIAAAVRRTVGLENEVLQRNKSAA